MREIKIWENLHSSVSAKRQHAEELSHILGAATEFYAFIYTYALVWKYRKNYTYEQHFRVPIRHVRRTYSKSNFLLFNYTNLWLVLLFKQEFEQQLAQFS